MSSIQHFDSVSLAAVAAELRSLGEGRIDKVGQPSAAELYLKFRAGGRNHRLYFNLRGPWARAHLTARSLPNLPRPSAFVMLLRKYMEGARLLRVEQPGLERAIHLVVAGRDELGDPYERRLVVELIGSYANAFLLDDRGVILGLARPVTEEMCRIRQLGVGLPYAGPPVSSKASFLDATASALGAAIAGDPAKGLAEHFSGLGRIAIAQLLSAAEPIADRHRVVETLGLAIANLRDGVFHPRWEAGPGWNYAMFWTRSVPPPSGPGASEILDAYYTARETESATASLRARLVVEVEGRMSRTRDRLEAWERQILESDRADREREIGELILANLHRIAPGVERVVVEDYFDPDLPQTTLSLDARLSPSENAQRYFRRARKLRAAREAVARLLAEGRETIAYEESVAVSIRQAVDLEALQEIARELSPPDPRSRQPEPPPRPLRFRSVDGLTILVGKNNRQNDLLTFKIAGPRDLWLHAQNLPGSHVIVEAADVPERTLREAAAIAAYFSAGREAGRVRVAYTLRKHVRKPRGARPGMVVYDHERTLLAEPDAALIEALRSEFA